MSRFPQWTCRLIAVGMFAALSDGVSAAADIGVAELPTIRGRSGATKDKLLVVGCRNPATTPDRRLLGEVAKKWAVRLDAKETAPPPREIGVKPLDKIDAKELRKLAEAWSSDVGGKRVKVEEMLKQLPPKHQALVKEYFDKLAKLKAEADKK